MTNHDMVTTSIFQKNTTTVRLITYIYTHNHIQADADTDVEYTKFCCLVPDSFTPEEECREQPSLLPVKELTPLL